MNRVGAEASDKQRDAFDSSIRKILSEMKKDREDQRHLMEELMKKIERPACSVLPEMEHPS